MNRIKAIISRKKTMIPMIRRLNRRKLYWIQNKSLEKILRIRLMSFRRIVEISRKLMTNWTKKMVL